MSEQTPDEMVSRVKQMAKGNSGTWDLSANDLAALRYVLSKMDESANDRERTMERLKRLLSAMTLADIDALVTLAESLAAKKAKRKDIGKILTMCLPLIFLLGCSSRLPNDRAAENNLRNPRPQKVARAVEGYVRPEPERNDPSEPQWAYPQHGPYHGTQRVTETPRIENAADEKTVRHYGRVGE